MVNVSTVEYDAWLRRCLQGAGEDVPILLGCEVPTTYDMFSVPWRSPYEQVGSYSDTVLSLRFLDVIFDYYGSPNAMVGTPLMRSYWRRMKDYVRELMGLRDQEKNAHIRQAKLPGFNSFMRHLTSSPDEILTHLEAITQESAFMAIFGGLTPHPPEELDPSKTSFVRHMIQSFHGCVGAIFASPRESATIPPPPEVIPVKVPMNRY